MYTNMQYFRIAILIDTQLQSTSTFQFGLLLFNKNNNGKNNFKIFLISLNILITAVRV